MEDTICPDSCPFPDNASRPNDGAFSNLGIGLYDRQCPHIDTVCHMSTRIYVGGWMPVSGSCRERLEMTLEKGKGQIGILNPDNRTFGAGKIILPEQDHCGTGMVKFGFVTGIGKECHLVTGGEFKRLDAMHFLVRIRMLQFSRDNLLQLT
jgi:hypothetical protein